MNTSKLQPLTGLLALLVATLGLVGLTNCGDEEQELNPSGSKCAVLSAVHGEAGASISGNQATGPLASYGFEAGVNGEVTVTPPSASACGNEVAQRLQGLCAVCEQNGAGACETLAQDLFNPGNAANFPASCSACGDGFCTSGESAVDEPGKVKCELDCTGGTSCGDGVCASTESPQTCPQDCETACGDGTCDNDESVDTCPQDCTAGTACGDGFCASTEQGNDPDDVDNYCPQDCCTGVQCGDGRCAPKCESVGSCAADCQECGDDICSDESTGGSENANTCARDCDICGDGTCGRAEVLRDPDAERGQRVCTQDCWVRNDGECSPGEPADMSPEDCNG